MNDINNMKTIRTSNTMNVMHAIGYGHKLASTRVDARDVRACVCICARVCT